MTNEEIISNLKAYRMQVNPVSPFKVFRDMDINALVEAKPKTIAALGQIKGFPPKGQRVTKYGEAIIAFFQNDCKIPKLDLF